MQRFSGTEGRFGFRHDTARRVFSAVLVACLATTGLVVLASSPAAAIDQTFAYTPGSTVSDGSPSAGQGNIEASGDRDLYTFTAQAGQMLTMTELACTWSSTIGSCGNASWELRSPSDTYASSGNFGTLSSTHFAAAETGTYTLIVATPANANPASYTATYSFRLTATTASVQTFPYTPGSTVSDGTPTAGQGNLETSGASDTYTFTAQAGQMLTMAELACTSTGSTGSCYNAGWQVQSPSDTYVSSGNFGALSVAHFAAAETGTYRLIVDLPASANPGSYTATYSFRLTATTVSDETFSYALGTTVSDGVPTAGQGNLETSGASDTYTFTAQAGQMLTMAELACTSTGTTGSCPGIDWQVQSPSDTYVTSGNFYQLSSPQFTAAETGTYTLVVTAPGSNDATRYTATYSFVLFSATGTVPNISTFNLSPTAGGAPLPVTATVAATDADGDPLTYLIDWGDGSSPMIGSLPTSPVGHTYATPGTHQATLLVSDGTNPPVAQHRTVTVSSPTPPNVTAFNVTPNTGVGPLEVDATFSASDPNSDPLTFVLDWGDGSEPEVGAYPAGTRTHTYQHPGTYHPTVTVSDGTWTDAEVRTVLVTPDQPLAANAGDDRATAVGETMTFDGSNSTPAAVIESYEWTFSDGMVLSGQVVTRSFPSPGTYGAVLTVEAGGITRLDSAIITVVPADTGAVVTVRSGGSPVVGAQVLVQTADGVQVSAVTAANGTATLWGLPDGDHTVYAYKSGFMGATGTVTVTDGNGAVTVELPTGSPGAAEIETRPLSYAEIVDAGIDPEDPDNQHVFEYEITLIFGPEVSSFTYIVNAVGAVVGGTGSGGGGGAPVTVGESVFVPTVQAIGEDLPPVVNWLVIPGEARWLKEFFEIRLIVSNLAPAGFTFTDGTATLELPAGLVLAPTAQPQALTVDVADVAGGTQEEVTWIVRGDEEGEYLPAATYSAVLDPVVAPINLRGETPPSQPLKVWACSALELVVHPDDHLDQYTPYRVRVGLRNVSDVPVYNVSNELKETGRLGFIYQPLETFKQGTAVIQPGDTFWSDYVLMPWITGGDLSESLSFVTQTGGNCSLDWTIEEQPAPTSRPAISQSVVGSNVRLSFDSIPGAVGYDAFGTSDVDTMAEYGIPNGLQPDTPFPSTPLASTNNGAATTLDVPIAALGEFDWVGLSVRFANGEREMLHRLVKLPSRITIGGAGVFEGDVGITALEFPVRLTAPAATTVTVDWITNPNKATPGVDFVSASGTVTFQPGEVEQTITVDVLTDTINEPGTLLFGIPIEAVVVMLSQPSGGLLQADPWARVGLGLIGDDDPQPTVSIGAAGVAEGDTGTTTLPVPVRLSAPSEGTVTVSWMTTSADQPEPGVDYEAASGTVTFAPGQTEQFVNLTVYGDTIDEPGQAYGAEWIGVVLTGSVNATLPGGWSNLGFGLIGDDD